MTIAPVTGRHLAEIIPIASQSFDPVWKEKEFLYFLEHACGFCFGLFDEKGALAAYFLGLLVRGELDIVSVATHPSHRRRGHSECLLRWILAQPKVEKAFLEVAVDNDPAVKLYEKIGFAHSGLRKKYYQAKRDAFLMRWNRSPAVS
jgi:ribosomal-protein-alanine N-acetyltransferase